MPYFESSNSKLKCIFSYIHIPTSRNSLPLLPELVATSFIYIVSHFCYLKFWNKLFGNLWILKTEHMLLRILSYFIIVKVWPQRWYTSISAIWNLALYKNSNQLLPLIAVLKIYSHDLLFQIRCVIPLTFADSFSNMSQQRPLPGLFPSFLKQLFPAALNWCTCGVLIPAFPSDTLDFTGSPGFYRIVPWQTNSIFITFL